MMASINNGASPGFENNKMSVGAMIAQTTTAQQRYEPRNIANKKNVFDANASHLLQKQMNSSRFGGFKTADGATQNKGHHP